MAPEQEDFDALAARIRACRLCVENPQGRPLAHEPRPVFRGRPSVRILIAGQAPGTRVHASGKPFTDPSGDRLRAWMGVSADEFYDESRIAIVPMGFCFPGLDAKGGDLPPRRECAPHWRAALLTRFPDIELTLAIGRHAQGWHLAGHTASSLGETVRDWRNHLASRHVLPLPHPSWRNNAWLKANLWFEAECLPVLRAQIRRILDSNKTPGGEADARTP